MIELNEMASVIESGGKTFTVLTSKQSTDSIPLSVTSTNLVMESEVSPIVSDPSPVIPLLSSTAEVKSTGTVIETSSTAPSSNSAMDSKETTQSSSAISGTECNETNANEILPKTAPGLKRYVDSQGIEVMSRTSYFSFVCCICKKIYKLKLPCIRHILVEHQIEVKEIKLPAPNPTKEKLQCPKCVKVFTKRNNLYRHIRNFHKGDGLKEVSKAVSEPEMPIACPVCNKGFNTFSGVNRHIRRYHAYEFDPEFQSSADMIPCSLCEMRFPEENALIKHINAFHHVARVVTKINMEGRKEDFFECGECSVQIKDPSELRNHIASNHGKFDFPIEVLSDNEDHEETNRVFNCDQCCKFFKTEQEWRTHMKEVHKAFPDSCCRRCGKICSTYLELRTHFKDVHFFTIPDTASGMAAVAPKHRAGTNIELSRSVWVAMEKIPKWLVKHAEGQLLLVVHKD